MRFSYLFTKLVFFILLSSPLMAQMKVNYDEEKIAAYTLPDILKLENGKAVEDINSWEKKRRPEILSQFENTMYGKVPGKIKLSSFKVLEERGEALDGKAIRKQVQLNFKKKDKELSVLVLIYLPKANKPAPLFVAYNFYGNQTTIADPSIILSEAWTPNNKSMGISENKASEESRGKRSHRWAINKIIENGFGLATIYYGDVDPDRNDFSDGVHPLLYKKNQTKPAPKEWGAISAWAWGLSRVMDYLETDKQIDRDKIIVMGHSRLGKTSLWAGARDQRFAAVISNNSGCGGAALFKRKFGETAAIMNKNFPHWLNDHFKAYSNKEETLALDQHMLISLIAPRPVYIASAEADRWADPKGEFLSGWHASKVFQLYGYEALENKKMPATNQPIHQRIGYHIRTGKHDVTDYDWEQYITFAKKHLF